MKQVLLWVFVVLVLQGCATMSEDECRSADWREVGYRDGLAGYQRSRVESHEKACNKVGIGVDRETYFRSRERGIRQYCQPENGVLLGRKGAAYTGVCPPDLAPAFERYYEAGRSVYEAWREVENMESERHRLEKRLDKAGKDEERRRIRDDLHHLDRRMHRARDDLRAREAWLEGNYHYRSN